MTTIHLYKAWDGTLFDNVEECMRYEKPHNEEMLQKQIDAYIADPDTRVYIYKNTETGVLYYSVAVENSGSFWLDSFHTEEEARQFVQKNNLRLVCEEVVGHIDEDWE